MKSLRAGLPCALLAGHLLAGLFPAISARAEEPASIQADNPTPVDRQPPGDDLKPVDYLKQVKPLLAARCYSCHGNLRQQSGLRLDTAGLMLSGGESGPVVVPGDSGQSLLIDALRGTGGMSLMPAEGEPLSEDQIALVAAWIDQGAVAPEEDIPEDPRLHWAFQSPVATDPPTVANQDWVRNPVDAFLAAEHQRQGLTPRPTAPRQVLLRRIYLDLIGLPPTRDELHAFLADESPDAFEQVVDRLLESPRYGERWGRHWMDVWRYSDWAGFGNEIRESQRHIWRWRDWIVESLNQDRPYDQMIVQMLAADELAPTDPDALRATGFLGRNWYKFNRNVWLENTIEHTSKAFLGLTMNCAKCHDHMYDPIAQQEFYQFRAFFEPLDVRTDRVAGQANLELDGLPRVYDANAATPTHLFFRGNEKSPDQEHPLSPAVPAILGNTDLAIAPVELPAVAWYPALNPFVQQESLAQARAEGDAARGVLAQAEAALAAARQKAAELAGAQPTPPAEAPPFLVDDFAAPRPESWRIDAGAWEYKDGHLKQSQTGSAECRITSLAPHPANFTAEFRFRITGGDQWRSVGLSFDVQEAGDFDAVYLSAVAGGSKLQVYHQHDGAQSYPAEGMKPLPIELGREYRLQVSTRGQLVNVSIDGASALAYRLPHERRSGALSLWAFDATADFLGVQLTALPVDAVLVEPNGQPAPTGEPMTVDAAQAAVAAAESAHALAMKQAAAADARATSVAARIAADNARYATPPAADAEALALAAGTAETAANLLTAEAELLAAEAALTTAQAALATAENDQTKQAATAAEAKVTEVKAKLAAAQTAAANPTAAYSPLGPVYPATSSGRRLALARWIADRRNPLTARVAVNHMWMRHFGEGLVPTMFDFGLNGKRPTHPALLDWLAVRFMDSGWSMKQLHRLLVTSNAYRMDSSAGAAEHPNLAIDRDNRYLWRMRSRRVEAEAVRDSVLHVAGQLDPTMGGPEIDEAQGLVSPRRSVYFRHANEKQMTFLLLFDAAGVTECYRRNESIVPQQALALANSPLSLAQSRVLAGRLTEQCPGDSSDDRSADETFIVAAFETVLSRSPSPEEQAECAAFLTRQAVQLADTQSLSAFTAGAANSVPPSADPRQRARENLVHVLMNHNDFVTIR
jgi:hypothetical protein